MEVLNMLNTKYFIVSDKNNQQQVQVNPDANGNVWFVNTVKIVNSANAEMQALDSLKTKTEAVIDVSKLDENINFNVERDSTATIKLTANKINYLQYISKSTKDQFAVFSEIYYGKGWNAYINNKIVTHYRVNYVLRGMMVPAGEQTIEFRFEPKVIQKGGVISLASYIVLMLVTLGWFLYDEKKKKKKL